MPRHGAAGEQRPSLARLDRDDAGQRDGLTTAEREELSRLNRELRVVREERDELAKAIAFFTKRNDPVNRYRFVAEKKANHSFVPLCRVLGVAKKRVLRLAAAEVVSLG